MSKNRDDFVRLANTRVNKALDSIRLVSNLSNRSNYTYTAEDADRIVAALRGAVTECKRKFDVATTGEAEAKFELS